MFEDNSITICVKNCIILFSDNGLACYQCTGDHIFLPEF